MLLPRTNIVTFLQEVSF